MGIEVKTPDCEYNKLIECSPDCRQCWRCGWNPKVMSDRLKRFYSRMNEEEKE